MEPRKNEIKDFQRTLRTWVGIINNHRHSHVSMPFLSDVLGGPGEVEEPMFRLIQEVGNGTITDLKEVKGS